MVRKAEKVMNLNRNLKSIENKNLKRLFTGTKEGRTINAISDADKKNIANDIVDRMSNLRDNPLLLQVENERRKIERQLKLTEKKNKASVAESPKKPKKEEDCIYIRNKWCSFPSLFYLYHSERMEAEPVPTRNMAQQR